MSIIQQKLTIKSITFKNRIGMSPMCQYSATNGLANEWHYVHYGTRAVGGSALIIFEATAISPEGRITPYDLGIWNDEQVTELRKITDFIAENNSVAGIQLAHAGRKASHDKPSSGGKQLTVSDGGWQTVGPSAIAFDEKEVAPASLDKAGIEKVKQDFKLAAQRVLDAGFKVIEIHAAHGYLLHQFLSPISNHRNDEYGGIFENRIRLLVETVEKIKEVWPENLPLFVRLSATDWTEGGWTLDETIELSRILKNKGVDLIDCSTGGNVPHARIPLSPGYQVSFSEALKSNGITTATVGLITTEKQIEEILINEQADMILLGRELLKNPYFPLQLQGAKWPEQYERAK